MKIRVRKFRRGAKHRSSSETDADSFGESCNPAGVFPDRCASGICAGARRPSRRSTPTGTAASYADSFGKPPTQAPPEAGVTIAVDVPVVTLGT